MRPSKLRRRLSVAGAIGAASLIGLIGVGGATAGADPGTGYPSFNNGVVNQIRGTGSDTTVFMMQKIGDLYTQAGLYGCTLNGAANVGLFNQAFVSTGSNEEYYCEGTWAALQAVTSTSSNVITAVSGTFPNLGTIPGRNSDPGCERRYDVHSVGHHHHGREYSHRHPVDAERNAHRQYTGFGWSHSSGRDAVGGYVPVQLRILR